MPYPLEILLILVYIFFQGEASKPGGPKRLHHFFLDFFSCEQGRTGRHIGRTYLGCTYLGFFSSRKQGRTGRHIGRAGVGRAGAGRRTEVALHITIMLTIAATCSAQAGEEHGLMD